MKKQSPKIAMLKYGLIAPLFMALLILTSSFVSSNAPEVIGSVSKEKTFIAQLFAEKIDIEGIVKSDEGDFLPGASIKVKNTDRITITDLKGNFSMKGVEEGSTLQVAFAGYETHEIQATPKPLNIILKQAAYKLEEIVVAGYEDKLPAISKAVSKEVSLQTDPQYPGGNEELYRFIGRNLTYPYQARKEKVEGEVIVSFVIDKEGNATRPQIKKGLGAGCDNEVLRIVGIMPKWRPARQNGMAVNVKYEMPVKFILQKKSSPEKESQNDETVFTQVEDNPEFVGGVKKMYEFIGKNLKYPAAAKEAGVEGRLFVRFIVTKKGDVDDIKILKGLGHGCEDEVKRILNMMPAWKPGYQNGKPVNVYFTMPFLFKLDQDDPSKKDREKIYLINGQKVDAVIAESVDKDKIESVDIKKGKDGKDVIYIKLKPLIRNKTGNIDYSRDKNEKVILKGVNPNPIFVVDGEKMDKAAFEDLGINPDDIASMNVLKGEKAITLYGSKGANGVIEVTLKEGGSSFTINPDHENYDTKISLKNIPEDVLLIVDGKEVNKRAFKKINPDDIATIDIKKGEQAIKYGTKAKNGVIVITLKK